MGKRERDGIRPGLIASVSLVGFIIFISVSLLLNFMFMSKIIPTELMSVLSKVIMFITSFAVCAIIKKRVKGDEFINCILACALYFVPVILLSIVSGEGSVNTAGIAICLFICLSGCLLLFMKKDKYGKMHKKRHRH